MSRLVDLDWSVRLVLGSDLEAGDRKRPQILELSLLLEDSNGARHVERVEVSMVDLPAIIDKLQKAR